MLRIFGRIGIGIGIVLLSVVLLLVALLLLILFVPVRYRVAGSRSEEKGLRGQAKATWLFSVITVFAVWEGQLHYGLRIFGISLYDNLKKKKEPKKKKRKEKKPKGKRLQKERPDSQSGRQGAADGYELPRAVTRYEPKTEFAEADRSKLPEQGAAKEPLPEQGAAKEPLQGQAKEPRLVSRYDTTEGSTKAEGSPGGGGLFHRIRGWFGRLWDKLKDFLTQLKELIEKLLAMLQTLRSRGIQKKETLEFYLELLQSEVLRQAAALCKRQALRLWHHIRPRKVLLDLKFGFTDPATTGQLLAVLGMLYPLLGKDIRWEADFEEQVCLGRLLIKGRIRLFVILWALWILYFDQNIRSVIRIWKKEEALHGRQ